MKYTDFNCSHSLIDHIVKIQLYIQVLLKRKGILKGELGSPDSYNFKFIEIDASLIGGVVYCSL